MANLYLFRGASATGKTTITDLLSKKYELPVFRKDDIYDSIQLNLSHQEKTQLSYDCLAKQIQTNLDLGIDLLLDIALPHKPYIERFLSKLDLETHDLHPYFCVCSDKKMWLDRWEIRMKNPAPNQLFLKLDEVESYYASMDFTLLQNEATVDSILKPDDILNHICLK